MGALFKLAGKVIKWDVTDVMNQSTAVDLWDMAKEWLL